METNKLKFKKPFGCKGKEKNSEERIISCSGKQNRTVYRMAMVSILMLGAFILGYLINPVYLRAGFLIITGTFFMLIVIVLFLVIFKVKSSNDKRE